MRVGRAFVIRARGQLQARPHQKPNIEPQSNLYALKQANANEQRHELKKEFLLTIGEVHIAQISGVAKVARLLREQKA
jgi:hypothetical protein